MRIGLDYQPSVAMQWPLLQNACMVRPQQRLHPQALPPSSSEQPLAERTGLRAGIVTRFLQHDMAFGELALVCPTGTEPHHALDWQAERPVALTRNVQRLTAPNPGFMTGPGTNSYLVGDANTGFIVIDPGPADADHIQRLWQAAVHPDGSGGNIRMIVCTHSHADHSPGAKPLQALCSEQPPILGLPSAPTARANSSFTPDEVLQNSELLTLVPRGLEADFTAGPPQGESTPSGGSAVHAVTSVGAHPSYTHTLQAIHTPGHAANHVCLLLVEDGLLFSGDHILNGSTTVIDPPDGHMGDYLQSLDTLLAACEAHDVQFIFPAHGHVLGGSQAAASGVISHLKAHRLKREAKIAAVMAAHPQGTLDDWVPLAYDDVDARVWPVAKRSLLAHVEHIRGLPACNDNNNKDTAL
jgi:recombination protein RecT